MPSSSCETLGVYQLVQRVRHQQKIPYSTADKADNPVSLYAATKKINEQMVHVYAKLYKTPSTSLHEGLRKFV